VQCAQPAISKFLMQTDKSKATIFNLLLWAWLKWIWCKWSNHFSEH